MSISPFSFHPIYMERVWGGENLTKVYKREIPATKKPCGESWEVVDRGLVQSVVKSGRYAGLTLSELWSNYREEVFGSNLPQSKNFPLLFKILDCQEDLSIQVHPPKSVADKLNSEAKSELWYIVDVKSGAKIYVGLKEKVSPEEFRKSIEAGNVSEQIHSIEPKVGDSIYLESGRIHAIGAGLLIFEIQQNSDTTYRVCDWNRLGLDGKPRPLHIDESIQSIDFNDVKPSMDCITGEEIINCEHFNVSRKVRNKGELLVFEKDTFAVLSIIRGVVINQDKETFVAGDTIFVPSNLSLIHI